MFLHTSARGRFQCPGSLRGRMARKWRGSYFLDLLTDDDRVVASDLLGAHLAVVERTVVLVTVPVYGTKQSTTAALEACNTKEGQREGWERDRVSHQSEIAISGLMATWVRFTALV